MTASILDVRLLERARKELNDQIDDKSAQIVSGLAGDYAGYRFRCGEINGLQAALGILSNIMKSLGDERL